MWEKARHIILSLVVDQFITAESLIFINFNDLIVFILVCKKLRENYAKKNGSCSNFLWFFYFFTRFSVTEHNEVKKIVAVCLVEWPWLVAFFNKVEGKFFCSGSLISQKHVVSGAWKHLKLKFHKKSREERLW